MRQAVGRKLKAGTDVGVAPETQVVVTNGAMRGLLASAMALADANDEVPIPSPRYFFRGNSERDFERFAAQWKPLRRGKRDGMNVPGA